MQRIGYWPLFLVILSQAALVKGGTTGSLKGTVYDYQGERLAGATVIVVNDKLNRHFEVTSDDKGRYRFSFLQPGRYRIVGIMPGFEQIWKNTGVAADSQTRLDLILTKEGTVIDPDLKYHNKVDERSLQKEENGDKDNLGVY